MGLANPQPALLISSWPVTQDDLSCSAASSHGVLPHGNCGSREKRPLWAVGGAHTLTTLWILRSRSLVVGPSSKRGYWLPLGKHEPSRGHGAQL